MPGNWPTDRQSEHRRFYPITAKILVLSAFFKHERDFGKKFLRFVVAGTTFAFRHRVYDALIKKNEWSFEVRTDNS
jgi:hypothetical protein